eukprot:g18155.t1
MSGGPGAGGGAANAVRRINRELKEINQNPSKFWTAEPANDDLFEWHFTLKGPAGTEFERGIYHGRIVLPLNYPFAPPHIMLLTPNGRFEINKKICLSISSYHPETWQPAWGLRTMIEALRSFFPSPAEGALGALNYTPETRRQIAEKESRQWRCSVCERTNEELLPLCDEVVEEDDKPDATAKVAEPPEKAASTSDAKKPPKSEESIKNSDPQQQQQQSATSTASKKGVSPSSKNTAALLRAAGEFSGGDSSQDSDTPLTEEKIEEIVKQQRAFVNKMREDQRKEEEERKERKAAKAKARAAAASCGAGSSGASTKNKGAPAKRSIWRELLPASSPLLMLDGIIGVCACAVCYMSYQYCRHFPGLLAG